MYWFIFGNTAKTIKLFTVKFSESFIFKKKCSAKSFGSCSLSKLFFFSSSILDKISVKVLQLLFPLHLSIFKSYKILISKIKSQTSKKKTSLASIFRQKRAKIIALRTFYSKKTFLLPSRTPHRYCLTSYTGHFSISTDYLV